MIRRCSRARLLCAAIFVALVSAVPCTGEESSAKLVQLPQEVTIRQLAPSIWLHTSVSVLGAFGKVSSNGLLIAASNGTVMIDTPATEAQTEEIFEWAEKQLKRPVSHVLFTHAHADRIGGIAVAKRHKAGTYAIDLTIELARTAGFSPPERTLPHEGKVEIGGIPLEVFYPGKGHSPDNIVVWVPEQKLLFAGCFVKDIQASTIGNLSDADPASWRSALTKVKAKFPQAQYVVPGHGIPGGMELLAHTEDLLKAVVQP
jgi:metallo-beta-lactamase class B